LEPGPKLKPPDGATATAGLFRAHARFVAGFLRRLGADEASVDDLVQDVFLVVHRKGGYQDEGHQPTTFLSAVAVRVLANHRRSRRRRPEVSDPLALDAQTSPAADPSEVAAARAGLGRVQQALDALEEGQRAAFVMYELNGEPGEAIANALGIPIGTVHSRLHLARKRFLAAYARLEEPGHG
jgi:RNA polymerase sigma-70 factor (ECF subfamily)